MATATLGLGATPTVHHQKKVFVGGLSWETDEQSLREYFAQYGPVSDCVIMRDRQTGHPRGFGFVTYDDQMVAERVAAEFHQLDGRQVEAKIAVPRSECVPAIRTNAWRATKKVFVGGLPATCRENDLHVHFQRFGDIAECQVMYDHQTGNSRGFGFVTFTNESTVDRVIDHEHHEIMGKHVEVKRAEPKQALEARRGREAAAAAAAAASASNTISNSIPSQTSQQQNQHTQQSQHATHSQLLMSSQKQANLIRHSPPNQSRLTSANSIPFPSSLPNPSTIQHGRSPPAQSLFNSFNDPWSSFSTSQATNSSSWNTLLSSSSSAFATSNILDTSSSLPLNGPNATDTRTQQQAPASTTNSAATARSPFAGMGFFTPAQPYSADLAQCVYNAFYGASTPQDPFPSDPHGTIPSARAERRFHPYSTRERVDRSYR